MRFIHTSDWHIGRLFQNVSLLEDQLYALAQIKAYAVQYNVDALLVSGDIFDRAIPPANAVKALDDFINDFIETVDIPIVMISGNHDSSDRLSFGAKQMSNAGVHLLTSIKDCEKPVIIEASGEQLALFGIPYHDPVQVREAFNDDLGELPIKTYDQAHTFLAEKIKAGFKQYEGMAKVLLSHCFIDGASESDSERPLSIGGADRVSYQPLIDFDYVALGHLHGPQYKGAEHIRYCGSLLKYSFSEHKQKKGVTLVEIKEGNVEHQHLDIKPKHNMRIIEGELEQLINDGKNDQHQHDYILARLTDKQLMLDPMGRLRSVYPNTLQIERTNFDNLEAKKLKSEGSATGQNQRDEKQVFSDFFSQVMDSELTEQQITILENTIKQARSAMEDE